MLIFKVVKDFCIAWNTVIILFCIADVTEALNAPAQYPGSSGTRNLHDNLSDLKAQVAANQKGINLIKNLIDEYGLDVVQAYMAHIQVSK